MNLEHYFGLTSFPFTKAKSNAAIVINPCFEQALSRMRFAIERDTIAMVVAQSGCGKSTLLSLFAKSLDAANYNIMTTSLTTLKPFSLISHLSTSIGLAGARFKGDATAMLLKQLRSLNKRTILMIDEAHLLPDSSLEDLRLMTADDLDRHSPFVLILVGQPVLRDRMAQPAHEALSQRIGIRVQLRPFTQTEVKEFLHLQIQIAGGSQQLFEPHAIDEIFRHSRGIPRLVQNIALHAMLDSMNFEKKSIDIESVQNCIVDMDLNS